jgi:hypothetical protein
MPGLEAFTSSVDAFICVRTSPHCGNVEGASVDVTREDDCTGKGDVLMDVDKTSVVGIVLLYNCWVVYIVVVGVDKGDLLPAIIVVATPFVTCALAQTK